ncbi:MAG: peptidylprolyl isomerase [Verrucomicrobiota bacterium]
MKHRCLSFLTVLAVVALLASPMRADFTLTDDGHFVTLATAAKSWESAQAGQRNGFDGGDLLARQAGSSPPSAPTNLAVSVTSLTTLSLSWSDTSAGEAGFRIGFRQGTSGSFSLLTTLPANSTNLSSITGAAEAMTYQFLVQIYSDAGSADSLIVTVTMPGITSRSYQPSIVGQPFSYTVTAARDGGAPDAFSVAGALPAGLSFDALTHQITGLPTEGGVFASTLSVHYPAWGTLSKVLTLRVIYPPGAPGATAPIPKQTLVSGGPAVTLALNGFFADRDTEQAVRFVTSKGNFDLALYATATPRTVTNFLNYVNRGGYSNSIVHRAVPGFIVQGGGFKPAPPNFTKIPTDPSPTNEPGVQNLRGTVAMAKLGSDPHSATDQWFVNLNDNSANLDNQNGGFTAFGRVCGNGMTVADAIAALPGGNYAVNVDGQNVPFDDWPMDTAPPPPATMDQSKLVLVNSVTKIEPLAFAVTATSVGGLATTALQGGNLVLTPASTFGGTTLLTVTATDLDGNTASQQVIVEVASAYTAWLNQHALQGGDSMPGADKDGDTIPNAVEFALAGSPVASDAASILPTGSLATVGGQPRATLAFNLRKSLGGAAVVIEASSTLAGGSWTTIWTSDDSSDLLVVQRVDQGDHWLITVRDTAPFSPGSTHRFLRLLVIVPR